MCSFAKLGAARGCGTPGIKTTTPGKNASLDATFLSRFSRLFRIGFPVLCYGRGCCNKTTGLAWAAWVGALLLGVSNFGVGQIAASFINYMYVAAAVMFQLLHVWRTAAGSGHAVLVPLPDARLPL